MVAHLDANPRVAALGPRLVYPDGRPQSSAWRFPSPETAALGLLTLGRAGILQSGGSRDPRRRLGDGRRASPPPRGARRGRPLRRGVLHLLRGDGPGAAPAQRGLADAVLPAGHRRAPRVAVQRRDPRAADQRDVARPPPLLAQAPLRGRRPTRGGPARARSTPRAGCSGRATATSPAGCGCTRATRSGCAGPASASWRRTGTASTRAARRPRLRQISPRAANLEPRCSFSLQTTTVRCARRSSVRCSCTATRSRSRPTGTRRWPPSIRARPTPSSST